MANKEQFLNKLASKMGRDRIRTTEDPKWLRHPWDHLHKELDQAGLVTQFGSELMKLGGIVVPVADEAELGRAIGAYLKEAGMTRLMAWPAGDMVKGSDPTEQLAEEGIEVSYWSEDGDRDGLIRQAESSQAGLVYASHGVSETGSIVLYNRGDRGRLVSLLPNQFLAVVRASTVVPRITQVLGQMAPRAREYSCVNFITGPSRTSDIEMDLTIGVHGPGRITIFLIEDI
ncbi:LutC/YkgG family protein [Gorillibacterium sp. sgz5001074]|uniref:LutC/YkgG family protein n=1 Tax=Gorillibacterium sp. sgz5001074 TaxID=3446695 RepID=UPI003F66B13A